MYLFECQIFVCFFDCLGQSENSLNGGVGLRKQFPMVNRRSKSW